MVAAIMDRDNRANTRRSSDLAALSERNEVLVGELQSKVTQLRMQVFQLANRAATLREQVERAEMQVRQYESVEDPKGSRWWRRS